MACSFFILSLAAASVATAYQSLTVITPECGECVTVTQQYQPVATCATTTTWVEGQCSTITPYTTYTYVSTVIPCAVEGPTSTSTTVTCIDQAITVSKCTSTITSVVQPTQTVFTTYYKEWVAPYNAIGEIAMDSYGGSGLCCACEANSEGLKTQFLNVTECWTCGDEQTCVGYPEIWVQQPITPVPVVVTAACQSTVTVPAAGTYTWSFPQTAPAKTITMGGVPTVCPAQPYYALVTQACAGATTIIIDVSVTQEVYYNYGMQTGQPGSWMPNQGGWNNWFGQPAQSGSNGGNNWQGPSITSPSVPTSSGTTIFPPFLIYAADSTTLGSRFAKRDILGYVNFENQVATIDPNINDADTFTIDSNRFMYSEGYYVGSYSTAVNLPMQEITGIPAGPHLWNRAANGIMSVDESTGFCILDNVVQILINQSPPAGCRPVNLIAGTAPNSVTTDVVMTETNAAGVVFTTTALETIPGSNLGPFDSLTTAVMTGTNGAGSVYTFTTTEEVGPGNGGATATNTNGNGSDNPTGVVITTTNAGGSVFTETLAPTATATIPACYNGQTTAPLFTLQVSAANLVNINGAVLGQDGSNLAVGVGSPANSQFTFNAACNIVDTSTGDIIVPGLNGQPALVVSPSQITSQGLSPAVCSISATSDLVCNGGNQFSVPLNSGSTPLLDLNSNTVDGVTGNLVTVKATIGGSPGSTTTSTTPPCFTAGVAPVFMLTGNVNNPAGVQTGNVIAQGDTLDVDPSGSPGVQFTFDTLCRLVDTATGDVAAVTPSGLQLVDPASNPNIAAVCNLVSGVLQCDDQSGNALNFATNTLTGSTFPLGLGTNLAGTSVTLRATNGGSTNTGATTGPCTGRGPFRLRVGPGSTLSGEFLTPVTGAGQVSGEVTFATSTSLLFSVDAQCNVRSNAGNAILAVGVPNVGEKVLIDSTGVAQTVGLACTIDPTTNVFECNNNGQFFALPPTAGVSVLGISPVSPTLPLLKQITLFAS